MKFTAEQKKLFRKNKKHLSKYFPALSGYFDIKIPANIDVTGEPDIDIVVNGNRFYGVDARVFAKNNIDLFVDAPQVIQTGYPIPTKEQTPFHLKVFSEFDAAFFRRKLVAQSDLARYDAAMAFSFGLGLGLHIEHILVETQCRGLVVVEPEPIFWVLSMYFVDWHKIIKSLDYRVAFIFDKEPDSAFSAIRNFAHSYNVGVQQTIYHIVHYHSDFIDSIHKRFKEKAHMLFDGLGYYDDEKVMMRNFILNAYCDTWHLAHVSSKPISGTAVIVGAGPSLDKNIAWLVENQDKVIIYSGGSALPTLLKNDITPDFHVEIENIALNIDLLGPLAQEYDLSDTVLVCSSTMNPVAARFFKRRMWFMREGVAASHIFDTGHSNLTWQNPTVVNTAVSAALGAGFRTLLLLGADFGTMDPKVHHSKGSFYDFHKELKSVEFKFPDKIKGNLGGTAYTNSHYKNGLNYIEILMMEFRSARGFNASNGAMVPRFTPISTDRFRIDEFLTNKKAIRDNIYNFSPTVDWDGIAESNLVDDLEKGFGQYVDMLRKNIKVFGKKEKDIIVFLMNIYRRINYSGEKEAVFNPMINGTINAITMMMVFFWRRIPEEFLSHYVSFSRHFWRIFINVLEEDFKMFINDIRQELPIVRPELFDDKGNLIIEAKPSVQNAE